MFIARHGNIETAIYIPLVIHTVHSLVQAQARVQLRWKTLHLIEGIPSSYTLFSYTSGAWYTPSRIPRSRRTVENTTRNTSINDDDDKLLVVENVRESPHTVILLRNTFNKHQHVCGRYPLIPVITICTQNNLSHPILSLLRNTSWIFQKSWRILLIRSIR